MQKGTHRVVGALAYCGGATALVLRTATAGVPGRRSAVARERGRVVLPLPVARGVLQRGRVRLPVRELRVLRAAVSLPVVLLLRELPAVPGRLQVPGLLPGRAAGTGPAGELLRVPVVLRLLRTVLLLLLSEPS